MAGKDEIKCEFWTPYQLMLIDSVEQLPIIYTRTLQPPREADLRAAWSYVSLEVAMPQTLCRLRWMIIRWNYLKIHQLMRVHNVPRAVLENHPKTKKYLYGNLNFLRPLLEGLTDADIPLHVHHRFNRIFDIKPVPLATVEMVKSWLSNGESPNCGEGCKEPEHDVSLLNNQVEVMSLTYQGKADDDGPSTSSSGCPGKDDVDAMCVSSDSEEE